MSSGHFRWDLKTRMGFGCGVTNRSPLGDWGQGHSKRHLLLGRKDDKPRQHIKKQRHHFADKDQQSYGFSSSHVWMWELDHKEGWAPKSWCFWTVVPEDSWESLGLQGDQTSQSKRIEYSLEGLCWSWSTNALATWCEELTHWKRHWC